MSNSISLPGPTPSQEVSDSGPTPNSQPPIITYQLPFPRLTRRRFLLSMAALGGVVAGRRPLLAWLQGSPNATITCDGGPTDNGDFFLDFDNWKRHGMAHLINVLWPGDDGDVAFEDDDSPFDSRLPQVAPGDDPADTSPGAYSACVVEAFFDAYYAFDSQSANLVLVSELDWWSRLLNCGPDWYFHHNGWAQQIRCCHGAEQSDLDLLVEAWEGARLITIALAFGAAHNYSVTNDLGWPGPSDHYYHGTSEGSHPNELWLRPAVATSDGNLP
ncbi:MAG: hypothetical protein AB1791_00645 [Chloroflexota bacterium]